MTIVTLQFVMQHATLAHGHDRRRIYSRFHMQEIIEWSGFLCGTFLKVMPRRDERCHRRNSFVHNIALYNYVKNCTAKTYGSVLEII